MKQIFNKEEAIHEYIKMRANNDDYRIFGKDKKESGKEGAKIFYVTTPNMIYKTMQTSIENNFYEYWIGNDNIAFSLDVDIEDLSVNPIMVVQNLIMNVIDACDKKLCKTIRVNDVIVLNSMSINKKYSFHIIFRSFVFENYHHCKYFYEYLVDNYDMAYSDPSIYGEKCLRLCFNSKCYKNNILIPYPIMINNQWTKMEKDCVTKYEYWLLSMITYCAKTEAKCNFEIVNKNISQKTNNIDNSKYNIKELIFKLPSKYYLEYEKWLEVGMILRNVSTDTDKMEYYDLWKDWSSQSDKFDERELNVKWKSFENSRKNKKLLGIGSLLHWLKAEGITDVTNSLDNIVNSYPEKKVVITLPTPIFSIENNVQIINQRKLNPGIYNNIIDKKLLAVQSEKGTGKTSNLFECLFNNNDVQDASILFISSRRTFGSKLYGDIKQYGFVLYSELTGTITQKKVICQIDSLKRVHNISFDYLIIDECESLARYSTCEHFKKKTDANYIIKQFELLIRNSDKIFLLDADLSDRCLNYYVNIHNSINSVNSDDRKAKYFTKDNSFMIVNNYRPFDEYTINYSYGSVWLSKLFNDINEGKKMVIPSASNNKAKDIFSLIRQRYPNKKILLINRETPDSEKSKYLTHVNEIWNNYDIIVYTPSVCMGVSFDLIHFDNIYVYGCSNSLGAQELCQMIHRVREPKDKNIYLTLDAFANYNEANDKVSRERIEEMLTSDYYLNKYDLYNNSIPFDIVVKNNDCRLDYKYKDEPIYDLFIRNSMELIEDRLNFGASLFGYFKFKKYKLNHFKEISGNTDLNKELKNIGKERKEQENEKSAIDISTANDITYEDYVKKLSQLNYNSTSITEKDMHEINKHKIKNIFNLNGGEIISNAFVKKYYNPDHVRWYINLSTILPVDNTQTIKDKLYILGVSYQTKFITDCYSDLTTKNAYANHYFAITLIENLHFDITNLEIYHNNNTFDQYYNTAIEWLNDTKIKDILSYKYNLPINNKNLSLLSKKKNLAIINKIINYQYGLIIKQLKDHYRLTDENKWNDIPRDVKIIPKPLDFNKLNAEQHIDDLE